MKQIDERSRHASLYEASDAELAQRYRWFCEAGWKIPVLNHPAVVYQTARPVFIDELIVKGMNDGK